MTYNEFIQQHEIHYGKTVYQVRKKGFQVHHVVPKCIGGTDNDGLVLLTPEEHIEAHRLFYLENTNLVPAKMAYQGTKAIVSQPKENSRRNLGNNYSKNRRIHYRWITNGSESKLFDRSKELPEGWHCGRHNQKAWNKGKTGIYSEETIEKIRQARFRQLNVNTTANIGKHWFTNGKENILSFSCPEVFSLGRVRRAS